jgi:saccharopine dehydrogenase (NAD+, L-lysine-forming)
MAHIKIGILRETKSPPDRRVPLTPGQCREVMERTSGLEIVVQPSGYRCFTNEEYIREGIRLQEELADCHVLMGVKEVDINTFLDQKIYLFFSHTAKKQPHNRYLLKAVVHRGITLVDYEYLTGADGQRVVAFGRWAGVVGAYNGIRAYGLRTGHFRLKPASECHNLEEVKKEVAPVDLERCRILVTGGGRVAGGALEILKAAGVEEVDDRSFLERTFPQPVFTRLDPWHYTKRRGGGDFSFDHFVSHPGEYENNILPYTRRTDMLITCHFWDPRSPVMLTRQDLAGDSNPIRIIADISCDINGPVASTIRASTIEEPFYGYDASEGRESDPFGDRSITVMAVDNLPGELPRDASADFGDALIRHVIPELTGERDTGMILHATIASGGKLTGEFSYLKDFLEGRE